MLSDINIQAALQIAIFAVTFADILTQPHMILETVGTRLYKLKENPRFGKLAYPLGYCAKCMAGMMALITGLFLCLSPVALVSFICLSILSAAFLSGLYQKVVR